VKKILCVVMFVALVSFFAMGQAKAPMATAGHGNAQVHGKYVPSPAGQPAICGGQCPFYGGDIDVNDPNANGFANGVTLLVNDAHTMGAIKPPFNAVVTGMVINNLVTVASGNNYDPAKATYTFRTGVSSGNGGTQVATGTAAIAHQATGRNAFGLPEDSVGAKLASPVPITSGTVYWSELEPQCTNANNGNCSSLQYFESNTDGLNGSNANLVPKYQVFFNSSFFGYNYINWCDLLGTGQTTACQGVSYAFAGHK
jgi:hypothetical protein